MHENSKKMQYKGKNIHYIKQQKLAIFINIASRVLSPGTKDIYDISYKILSPVCSLSRNRKSGPMNQEFCNT